MEVVVIGTLSKTREQLKPIIEKMGGKLVTKIHPKTSVVLSTEAEVEKMNKRMQEVQNNNIQVCTENFLDDIKEGGTLEYIAKNSICDWGSDVGFLNLDIVRVNILNDFHSSRSLESIKTSRF